MTKIKIKNSEVENLLGGNTPIFPKYTTLLLNIANRTTKGTAPKIVGQMTELIREFDGINLEEWEAWYFRKKPEALEKATDLVFEMMQRFKEAADKIDRNMVRDWIKDLIITKTFSGLKYQDAIIKKIAELKNMQYRIASTSEEAKGIDGFIGERPISIKPITYKSKPELIENIQASLIFYSKKKDGIAVEFDF